MITITGFLGVPYRPCAGNFCMMRAMSKKSLQDPYADREAAKYEQPIVSREFLLETFQEAQGPLLFEHLTYLLKYNDPEQQIALQRRLGAMVRDGQLFRNRRGQYAVVTQADLIAGVVIGHADGFGFLKPDRGGDDLFLSPKQMRTLMHGDRALVCESGRDRRGRREGKLVEVIERGMREVSGHYYKEGGFGFVAPENQRLSQDILIPPGQEGGAQHGDIVVARIDEYPTRRSHAIAHVSEVLGNSLSPAMHIELAIRKFGLPYEWSEEVLSSLSDLQDTLPDTEIARRRDVRDVPLVTIDGEDARDFDDAVYCEPTSKGWKLLVAIADVSWYVQPGTALDTEAYERSTSTYFPNRVVPMLPEVLSNGLCSINPDVDRFCMLCEMEISRKGKLIRTRFDQAVMRSHARLTYTKAAAMLIAQDEALCHEYRDILPHLQHLYELYGVLANARQRRGAIAFESDETQFVFDKNGAVVDVVPLVRNEAHKIIEECMITANIATARYLEKHDMPALFRVHGGPAEDDLASLREFLAELGLSLGGGETPTPKDYDRLLNDTRDRPDAHVIQTVLLRSLKQAVYQPGNEGHFGLSLDSYAHFTSPIRRYPDLLVHRAIRHLIEGGNAGNYRYSLSDMEKAGVQCSSHERRADEASWDVIEALKCQFLSDRVEEEFEGVVGGVNNFGLFVDLDGLGISGLVHITALGHDYFHHDPVRHRLVGEHTGVAFRLGESLRVRLIRVDVDGRKIDLEPVTLPKALQKTAEYKPKKPGGRGSHRRGRRR